MTTLSRHPSLLHRLTAVLGVVLVVLLDLLVVSPGLHVWVHRHDGSAIGCQTDAPGRAGATAPATGEHHSESAPVGAPDHQCAATLFAHGVEALLFVCLQLLLLVPVCCAVLRASDRRVVARPRYWHVPAIGPPVV